MKRVVLTGGAGFVGANLTRALLDEGHEVHLLVRPGSDLWRLEEIRADVSIVEVDLCDAEGVSACVAPARPDWVFHLAAHGAYPAPKDVGRMVATNIEATMAVVQAGIDAGAEAIVNTGSSSEYGLKDHPPAETEHLEPNSHYAWTKAAATHYCRHMAVTSGVRLPTLRLYSVFGPYEEPGRLVPTLIARGLEGRLPPLVGPDTARDFVYVGDVSRAYLLAASAPQEEKGAVYNVGSGRQTTIEEAVKVARASLDIPGEPAWGSMEQRSWDSTCWVSDNRKIAGKLGWVPEFTFEEGFERFVDWFRQNPGLRNRYS